MSTILVVDDDFDTCALISLKLRSRGFDVRTAANGEEALAEISEARPDLIVLDIMMPKLGGFDVCRRLRDDNATSDIPIIMLTSRACESDVEQGLAVGADEYMAKPFSPRELIERVALLLSRPTARPST